MITWDHLCVKEYSLKNARSEQRCKRNKFFDELFDSMNGSYDNFNKIRVKLLLGPVTPRSNHNKLWSLSKKDLSSMTFQKKDGKSVTVPSIKNWLHTIGSIEYLVKILQK